MINKKYTSNNSAPLCLRESKLKYMCMAWKCSALVLFIMLSSGLCFGQSNFSKGEELFMQNEPQQAVTFLERAFAEDQTNALTSLYLGFVYEQLGRTEDAITLYRRILPGAGELSANISTNLGNLYFKRGNYEEAERCYTQAIDFDAEYSAAYLGRANTRIRARNVIHAIPDYEQYIALMPQDTQRSNIEELVNLIRSEIAVEEMRRMLAEEEEARRKQEEEERIRAEQELLALMAQVNDLVAEGKAKLDTNDFSEASQLFSEARRIMPSKDPRFEAQKLSEMADAYYDYASRNSDTAEGREAISNAVTAANDAVAKDSALGSPHYILGKIARDANQNEKALSEFRDAARLDPNNFMYSHDYGRMLFISRNLSAAKDAFQNAVRINPDFETSWYNLGGTLRALNNPEEALAAYRRAVTIKEDYAAAHREIGRILLARNDTRGAVDAFSKALQHNPNDFTAMRELGDAQSQAKNFIEADNIYAKALSVNPFDAQTNHNMALVKIELERLNEALDYARKAVESAPNNAVYMYTMGLVLEKSGAIDPAIIAYKSSASLDSRYIRPRINLGNLLVTIHNYSDAVSFLNQALAVAPTDFEVNKNLGAAYTQLEDWRNSITHYERAIAAKPNDPALLVDLSRAYASSGDHQKAVTTYQQVLRIQSNNWDAMFELSKVYVTLGQFNDARRYLQDLINRNPNYHDRAEADRILKGL